MKPMFKNGNISYKKSDFWTFLKNPKSWQLGVNLLA